jgi:hypothetical protein
MKLRKKSHEYQVQPSRGIWWSKRRRRQFGRQPEPNARVYRSYRSSKQRSPGQLALRRLLSQSGVAGRMSGHPFRAQRPRQGDIESKLLLTVWAVIGHVF